MTGSPKSPGLQILRPRPRQSFLVLVLRPPGGSKNENVCVDEQTKGSIAPDVLSEVNHGLYREL